VQDLDVLRAKFMKSSTDVSGATYNPIVKAKEKETNEKVLHAT
jgi:hypothetical protein